MLATHKRPFLETLVTLFAVTALSCAPVGAQSVAAAPNKSESVRLFDGKTLAGWVVLGGLASYTVDDGVIVGTALKRDGVTTAPLDPDRAQRFVEVVRAR